MPAYGRKLPLNGHFRLSKQVVQVVRTQFPFRVSNEWAVTYPINAGNHIATFGTKNTAPAGSGSSPRRAPPRGMSPLHRGWQGWTGGKFANNTD
jgi:hypothetical protein